jgi:hypothetical protein
VAEVVGTGASGREGPILRAALAGPVRPVAERLCEAAAEEAAEQGPGRHAFVFRVVDEAGHELQRERARFEGGEARAPLAVGPAAALAANLDGDDARGSVRHEASWASLCRQQMRHNEGLISLVVHGGEAQLAAAQQVIALQSRIIEQQGAQIERLMAAQITAGEREIELRAQRRLLDAEARREEVEAAAIQTTAGVLAEWLPVGVRAIAKRYGLGGDARVDPMLEQIVSSFTAEQLPALAAAMTPVQRNLFAELWETVQARKEAAAGTLPAGAS